MRIIINSRIDLSKWIHQQLWHGFISVELWTPYGCNDNIDDTSILNSDTCKSVNVIGIINSAPTCKRSHGNRHHTCQCNRKKGAVVGMIVGFTTTYAISAFHHWCCEFKSRWGRGVQHYVIKFVSDLRQVGGFLRVPRFPPPIKLTATI